MSHSQRLQGEAERASASRFNLTVVPAGNGCREVRVEGELDAAVVDRLLQAIQSCQGDRVLIGLESCRFIDSTGIAAIVTAHRGEGPQVVVHSPRGQVLRMLGITGLLVTDLVFANREQALSAFGSTDAPDGAAVGGPPG